MLSSGKEPIYKTIVKSQFLLESWRFSENKGFELMKKLDDVCGRKKYLNVIEKLN